jgi:Suppressor of fused protein (SUFU)
LNIDEYKRLYSVPDSSPGWKAIDARLKPLYGDQEPVHYPGGLHPSLGGANQLEGISVYTTASGGIPHLHYVSYGLSRLHYDERAVGGEFSRFGFEFTFRLKAAASEKDKNPWPANMMQNLARYVVKSKQVKVFDEYHFMNSGPIRVDVETRITALAFAIDPELGRMETPHGKVDFLQIVGLTGREFDALMEDKGEGVPALLEKLRTGNPMLVTDLQRS